MRPLIQVSLEPNRRRDLERLTLAINRLTTDDHSLETHVGDTGQLVLGCRSEEHLARALAALAQLDELPITIGRPTVAYLETITKPVEHIYTYKKQAGASGQYAEVKIAFEPLEQDQGFEFVNRIVDEAIPREFIPAVEKGLIAQKDDGVLSGFPTIDFRATLLDGKYHDVDSNALTFEIAARACFRNAMRLADPIILEPVMRVEIVTPETVSTE